jgi:hypothetical protein
MPRGACAPAGACGGRGGRWGRGGRRTRRVALHGTAAWGGAAGRCSRGGRAPQTSYEAIDRPCAPLAGRGLGAHGSASDTLSALTVVRSAETTARDLAFCGLQQHSDAPPAAGRACRGDDNGFESPSQLGACSNRSPTTPKTERAQGEGHRSRRVICGAMAASEGATALIGVLNKVIKYAVAAGMGASVLQTSLFTGEDPRRPGPFAPPPGRPAPRRCPHAPWHDRKPSVQSMAASGP